VLGRLIRHISMKPRLISAIAAAVLSHVPASFLFACGLLNDSVSNSDCLGLNGKKFAE
jgi:hypothetical protein